MRIARICDPEAHQPYPSFEHGTTMFVAIRHDAPSQLFVFNDEEPSWASIQVDGREVHAVRLDGTQAVIELHTLVAPPPQPSNIGDALAALLSGWRNRKPGCRNHQRLYAFSVVLQADTREREVLATYEFHILCPREYAEACGVHRQICHSPAVIAPDTIPDRAEGRNCPDCKRTRETRS